MSLPLSRRRSGMSDDALAIYAQRLIAEVLAAADADSLTTPETFTRRALDDLEQAGVTENTFAAYYAGERGVEISGYGSNESLDALDVFITDFRADPQVTWLTKADVEARFRRVLKFVQRCQDGIKQQIDESDDVYDMCLAIEKKLPEVSRIRLFLLTNSDASITSLPETEFGDLPVGYEIWDLTRFHRMTSSGMLSEPIMVEFGDPLPCLATPTIDGTFSVFMAILPGPMLASLYGQYGTRLLELNVRSFLQTKGAVNRGIRGTLLAQPERFLAYNNGISATASRVEFATLPGGGQAIKRIHDLQIVNGGQTTASIHYAHVKDKADISSVFVQMKLTVVAPDRLEEIVPEISKYSNTQNKVTLVDFSSNHPYHVAVEKITRSLWAPAADGSGQETRWFYERARGQYTDALARERTPARQKAFKALHPLSQKFTKSDLAKFEHSWRQMPHIVSLGAEKNFREFMINMGEKAPDVDALYCERLIAKAILFKATEKIVTGLGMQGFRANVVTYTIAKLASATGQRIDLDRIWQEQRLSPALTAAIDDLSRRIRRIIVTPVGNANVTEWAKRPECWRRASDIEWMVSDELRAEYADPATTVRRGRHAAETDSHAAARLKIAVASIPAEDWLAVAAWAKDTKNLEPWQWRVAAQVGKYLKSGWDLTIHQAEQAERLMADAQRLGFRSGAR
jgi:AIPR protein/abortive infection phage resistance-like protein